MVMLALVSGVAMLPAARAEAVSSPGLIAFASDRDHPLSCNCVPSGYQLIYSMNSNGTGAKRLTFNNTGIGDSSPDWSYDASKLAFVRSEQVWVMNADGSGQTQVTHDTGGVFMPSWSPDGTKIAYELRASGTSQIVVINANGSNQQALTSASLNSENPAWSPDGTKIAFDSDRGVTGLPEIYVMNANGSSQTPLTTDTYSATAPAWSPDGTKLAFTGTYIVVSNSTTTHITIINANGTGEHQLTTGTGSEGGATWSPDGKMIAFNGIEPPSPGKYVPPQIYSINSNGSGQVDLTNNLNDQDGSPAWQKNSTPKLTVVVKDPAGKAIAGVPIIVTGPHDGKSVTDAGGTATFQFPPGDYTVSPPGDGTDMPASTNNPDCIPSTTTCAVHLDKDRTVQFVQRCVQPTPDGRPLPAERRIRSRGPSGSGSSKRWAASPSSPTARSPLSSRCASTESTWWRASRTWWCCTQISRR
jgi:Tol biopolymer transport system component